MGGAALKPQDPAYDPRQAQFEADQLAAARSTLKGDLFIVLLLGFAALTAGLLYFVFYASYVPVTIVIILVIYFSISVVASSPARFPVRMTIGDRGIDFRSRFRTWDRSVKWDQVMRIIAADSPPGRFYKAHFYMLSIYRHRRISNMLRVYLGEVGFRELEEAAAKRGIRITFYPPRGPKAAEDQ